MSLRINTFQLVMGFSRALDLVNPLLAGHHLNVAFLADGMARRLGLSGRERQTLFIAAMLHDAGAIPLRVSASDLFFERHAERHARAGWAFLRSCGMLDDAAELVLLHHEPWREAARLGVAGRPANIINLADRVEMRLRSGDKTPDESLNAMRLHLRQRQPQIFHPLHVEAMLEVLRDPVLAGKPLEEAPLAEILAEQFRDAWLDMPEVTGFSLLFALIIDSISPFTATHSMGVARTARNLLELSGLAEGTREVMFVAGLLHDIGKLGVPAALLEKPGPLTHEEFGVMKQHAVLCSELLGGIVGFEQVRAWGAPHHEHMDGNGYPYGLTAEQLPLPARMVAVADVFTAVTEDRPYRCGMPLPDALNLLHSMSGSHLDADMTALLIRHADRINADRLQAQGEARRFAEALHLACENPALLRTADRLLLP